MKKTKFAFIIALFLLNISVKAQDIIGIESTIARAYDFWGHSDKDKDIFVHYENVNVETPTSIPIKLIYSYDYKNKILRFLTNNSNCYLVLSKDCNKRINKQLKNYNVTNLQGDDINKMIETYRNALKSKYQHINDSIQHTREIARKEQERKKAIEDSIRFVQESKTHIKFMGIELNNAVDLAMLDLQKKGFELLDIRKEGYALSGKFMNRNSTIMLHATPKLNNIYKVSIFFDEEKSWYGLKSEFLNIVKSYRTKYKCIDSGRTFLEPYYEGDGFELQGVAKDKCCYFDKYQTEGGTIYIEISDLKCIKIQYKDSFNSKLNEKETISEYLDEI